VVPEQRVPNDRLVVELEAVTSAGVVGVSPPMRTVELHLACLTSAPLERPDGQRCNAHAASLRMSARRRLAAVIFALHSGDRLYVRFGDPAARQAAHVR